MTDKKKKITVDDLVESSYNMEELDFTEMYAYVGQAYKEDPLIKVLTNDVFIQGKRASRVCLIDPSEGEIGIGMAEIDPLPYIPVEDWDGVDAIFNYCRSRKFQYGDGLFPDVPISVDGFPTNQHLRPVQGFDLEKVFFRKGFRLLNASYGCVQALRDEMEIFHTEERAGFSLYDDDPKYFYFVPYKDLNLDGHVISMQFNPFHPMSIRFINDAQWDQNVLSGHYKYRGKLISFSFDLDDRRYRIHSEDWRQIYGQMNGFIETFDLVSYFDMQEKLQLTQSYREAIEPLILEPLKILSSTASYPYSYIGPYSRGISRGYSSCSYVPYSRTIHIARQGFEYFDEITEYSEFYGNGFKYNDEIYEVKDGIIQSREIFLRVVRREDQTYFRAFISANHDQGFKFIRSDVMFRSFPINLSGSIIYPHEATTLIELIQSGNENHEFLPSYVSLHHAPDFEFEQSDLVLDEEEPVSMYMNQDENASVVEHGYYLTCIVCGKQCSHHRYYDGDRGRYYYHLKCYKCPCGRIRDLVALRDEHDKITLRCNKPYKCDLRHQCIVCRLSHGTQIGGKYRIGSDGDYFYYHSWCIYCVCKKYTSVIEQGGKYYCSCTCKPTVKMKERGKVLFTQMEPHDDDL